METRLLTAGDYRELVPIDDCIAAVEHAFGQHGEGKVSSGLLSAHLDDGAVHIKTSACGRYFAAKLNANFPGNRDLPTIQGVVVLFDATCGAPLAIIDSTEITKQRTAAASAVAAKYLARRDARTLMVYGCGEQARAQVRAIARVLPIERIFAHDVDAAKRDAFVASMSEEPAAEVRAGVEKADVIVTCTTSKRPFLRSEHVAAGAFVAAVGADNPEKGEIDPELMGRAVVVADVLEQCATIGDLRGAIAAGTMSREAVRAELGAIVAGRASGRRSDDEIIVFDSTGAGFQDVAAASIAYERAVEAGRGTRIDFRGSA